MWKKQEDAVLGQTDFAVPPQSVTTGSSGGQTGQSIVGRSLVVKGELSGSQDLGIEGRVEGVINLPSNSVTVRNTGHVEGNVFADAIHVEGTIVGDIFGTTQVVVYSSGNVRGNITAPQVCLEQGAKLKGRVDMDPHPGQNALPQWSEEEQDATAEEDEYSELEEADDKLPLNGSPDASF